MYLTVFENGNASLNVNCKDRQPISYNGEIESKKASRQRNAPTVYCSHNNSKRDK